MVGGLGSELQKDEDGKYIIEPDKPNKISNHFYRQSYGKSVYFELEAGGSLVEGLRFCLEVSKQENCLVNYDTCRIGVMPVTPEMTNQDAVNSFICQGYIKSEMSKPSENGENAKHAQRIRAAANAPESITLTDYYFAKVCNLSDCAENIVNFCDAHKIDLNALLMHFDMAVGGDISKADSGKLDDMAKGYGLPDCITKDNLPELRKKIVLLPADARVTRGKKNSASSQQHKEYSV